MFYEQTILLQDARKIVFSDCTVQITEHHYNCDYDTAARRRLTASARFRENPIRKKNILNIPK